MQSIQQDVFYFGSLKERIPITYINKTGSIDFDVVVFMHNSRNSVEDIRLPWQILRAQSSVTFTYPADMQVGATYIRNEQLVSAGPFNAKNGTTWEILQENTLFTPHLKQGNQSICMYNNFYFSKYLS